MIKLINLNIWWGRLSDKLLDFIKKKNNKIDIFCFQEVFRWGYNKYHEDMENIDNIDPYILEKIRDILSEYNYIFCSYHEWIYGTIIFVKKNLEIIEDWHVNIYENKEFPNPLNKDLDHTRTMQWIRIKYKNKNYLIMNLHWHWTWKNKLDTKERIEQSQNILNFTEKSKVAKVICWDFNLLPNTKSIQMLWIKFENLISKNQILWTRTSYYKKSEKYADYIFTSKKIEDIEFSVLTEEVSDHAILQLEFI